MKNKRFLSVLSAGLLGLVLTACGGGSTVDPTPTPDPDPVEPDTPDVPDLPDEHCTLSMSVNYDKTTGLSYNEDTDYSTPNGTKIKKGDLKPVWASVSKQLDFTIDDVTDSSGKATDYFKNNWKTNQYADITVGNVTDISSYGTETGTILDLNEYMDYLPNFKAFLEANPIVKVSIETTSYKDSSKSAIYYAPYFDGFDDVEKYTLVRADFVRKILDEENVEWDTNTGLLTNASYKGLEGDTSFEASVPASMESLETKTISKKSGVENIITQQNKLIEAGKADAKTLVAQFRQYISDKYGSQYATKSDLFLGVDASYDADEMIALMRIVKASPKALTGDASTEMIAFVPREYNNSRLSDLYRWGASLWGVRGLESRKGYLYVGADGQIHDARGESDTVELISNLNALYNEGLILQNLETKAQYGITDGKFAAGLFNGNGTSNENGKWCGFMEYDYSQSQGAWNDKAGSKALEGYDFRPIVNAFAQWDDKESGSTWMQFTESWRSVKTEGWCINSAIVKDEAKLAKALKLFDFFYSDEGQALYTAGPKDEGYYTEIVDGVPQLSEATLAQFHDTSIGKDNYTNYFRKYVGAGLNIGSVKNYGVEVQCTNAKAVAGCNIVAHALKVGTFKHTELEFTDEPFYTITPSSFNLAAGESTQIAALESAGLNNIHTNSSTSNFNIWNKYVMYGFGGTTSTGEALKSKEAYLTWVNDELSLKKEVKIYNDAYELMKL